MNGSASSWAVKYVACPTCRLSLGLAPGEVARGLVPWHFDARPLKCGQVDREACPEVGKPLPEGM